MDGETLKPHSSKTQIAPVTNPGGSRRRSTEAPRQAPLNGGPQAGPPRAPIACHSSFCLLKFVSELDLTIAYLITLEGARSLVQHVESNGFPKAVDSFMNDFLIARDRHYIADRILATTTFLKFGSDID